jgi:hypothetical protein
MKKIFLGLFLLLLTSCQSSSPIEAFDASENCPHVCWLGINPGVTTEADTKAILNKSNQIKQRSIIEDESGIQAEWYPVNSFPNRIGITFENGFAKQISISNVYPLTVGDLVSLFGKPSEIDININVVSDAVYADYMLFYSARQLAIFATTINNNGPDPKDGILWLVLIDKLDFNHPPKWLDKQIDNRQPWLGFGHLKDYFPGQDIPNLGSWAFDPEAP